MKKITPLLLFLLCSNVVVGQFGGENDISKSSARVQDSKFCDLDGDGNQDIIAICMGKIVWYKNFGGLQYGEQIILAKTEEYFLKLKIDAKDMDNDGDLDIVASSYNNMTNIGKIVWYENNGNTGFFNSERIITTNNEWIETIFVHDIDNDGDIDVVFGTDVTMKVFWVENVGGGNFNTEQVIYTGTKVIFSVYADDFDADGDLDILFGSSDKVGLIKNLGGGSFASAVPVITSTFPSNRTYVSSGDFDNDNDVDIVWASENHELIWVENDGNGNFSNSHNLINSSTTFTPWAIYTCDIDGDSDLDILLSATGNTNQLTWYENSGSGFSCCGFSERIIPTNGGNILSIHAVDLDNDGDLEILSSSSDDDEISINENFGGSNNIGIQNIISEFIIDVQDIYSADMDNDGDNDIIAASEAESEISLYENLGGGNMKKKMIISDTALGARSIHAADLDNDGDLDILSALRYADAIVWFENLGGNIYGSQQVILGLAYDARDAYPADMDNDGDLDIIAIYENQSNISMVSWIENLGGGVFSSTVNFVVTQSNIGCLGAVDTDGDGFLNAIYREYEVYAIDMDNDSDDDIVETRNLTYSGYARFVRNDGGGNWNNFTGTSSMKRVHSMHVGDIDGDGYIDIVAGSDTVGGPIGTFEKAIVWYKNNGGVGFGNSNRLYIQSEIVSENIFLVDIDGDGDKDIIQSSLGNHKISWYENFHFSPYQLIGNLYYDANQNKIKDTNEIGLSFIQMQLQPTGQSCYTSTTGEYIFAPDTGVYVVNYIPNTLWNLTTDSVSYNRTLTGASPLVDSLDFGFFPDTIFTSIQTDFTGGFPRCNDTINYWIDVYNQGTTLPNGVIHVQLDDSVAFVSAAITPDSIVGQNIYWSYDSLFFYSHLNINLQVTMPPFTNMGDTLTSYLTVYELDGFGNIIYTNTDSLNQVSVCAYDPNDKSVLPKGIGVEGFILNDEPFLEYLIRFQNTGNDTAITVMVRDQLDSNLDWNSMQIISHSHNMQAWIEQDGEAVFKFENIMLPDSGADFIASQGYVKFRINLKPNIISGTQIFNKSNIYFDSNPPVITNVVLNTVYDCENALVNIVNSPTCFGENLVANSPEGSIINYFWEIDSFYTDSSAILIWQADTVGVFDLKLTINNPFCSKDTTVSVTIYPSIPITNTNQSICQGDSIQIGGLFQTSAGTYYDSLQTINGCDSVLSITLSVNPIYLSNTNDTVCQGDSVLIYGNYENTAGVYYDTLQTILGCDSVLATTLFLNANFNTSQNQEICQGDSIILGGSYQTIGGVYYDSLQTINGCDSVLSTTLTVNSLPNVTLNNFNPDTICSTSNAVTLPNGSPSGGVYSGTGVSGGTFDPNISGVGTHSVIYTYTDINSCINSDSTFITVEQCVGMDDLAKDLGILIYPNPNTGLFTIEKPMELDKEVDISLLDASSRIIINKIIPKGQQKIEMDITNYSKGVYYLQLTVGKEVYVKQILKN